MEKVLAGVLPVVIGLVLYTIISNHPITIPVVLVMGATTIPYQFIKLRFINSSNKETTRG